MTEIEALENEYVLKNSPMLAIFAMGKMLLPPIVVGLSFLWFTPSVFELSPISICILIYVVMAHGVHLAEPMLKLFQPEFLFSMNWDGFQLGWKGKRIPWKFVSSVNHRVDLPDSPVKEDQARGPEYLEVNLISGKSLKVGAWENSESLKAAMEIADHFLELNMISLEAPASEMHNETTGTQKKKSSQEAGIEKQKNIVFL